MNNLFLSHKYHSTTNNVVQSVLTPPDWFTELHSHAPQTAGDVGYGSLDTYCELSVPPLRGAESEPQFTQDLRQLQQFIQKKVSVLDARKGATGFVFYPNVARKRIQKIFTFASPIAHKAFTDDEIKYMLDPHNYIGLAPQFVDRVLAKYDK